MRHHLWLDGISHPRAYCEISHLLPEDLRRPAGGYLSIQGQAQRRVPPAGLLRVNDPNMGLSGMLLDTPDCFVGGGGRKNAPPHTHKRERFTWNPHKTKAIHKRTDGFYFGTIPGLASMQSHFAAAEPKTLSFLKEGAQQWGEIIDYKIKGVT